MNSDLEKRHNNPAIPGWVYISLAGLVVYGLLSFNCFSANIYLEAAAALLAGVLILPGACEALVVAAEKMGKKYCWNGFLAGTIGEILSTLPEFVVITFVVFVSPLTAVTIALVTVYNNAVFLAIYSFFLPKNKFGTFKLPPAITYAATELLACGAGITFLMGITMIIFRTVKNPPVTHFSSNDLIIFASLMFVIIVMYLRTLLKYYAGSEEHEDIYDILVAECQQDIPIYVIFSYLAAGVFGAVLGGESVSHFAHIALDKINMSNIVTSIILAAFAGMSEYVIVYKAHRRGELGIALSNVFGGITQVMFLVFPFSILCIGVVSKLGMMPPDFVGLPINSTMIILVVLLFPVFYILLETILNDRRFSNFDATVLTAIYVLMLYLMINYG